MDTILAALGIFLVAFVGYTAGHTLDSRHVTVDKLQRITCNRQEFTMNIESTCLVKTNEYGWPFIVRIDHQLVEADPTTLRAAGEIIVEKDTESNRYDVSPNVVLVVLLAIAIPSTGFYAYDRRHRN